MNIKQLIVFSLLLSSVICELSLVPSAVFKDRKYYQSTVGNAAQAALKQLQTKDNPIAKSFKVSKVDLEDTKVAESLLYSVNLQIDGGNIQGDQYGLKFAQPITPWRSVHTASALPSSAARRSSNHMTVHGSAPSYMPPEMSLTLNGPMELFFPQATTDLDIKTPRSVDVGFVDRVILKEGANITLTGSVELRLRESISIEPSISLEDSLLFIDAADKPKLNVYGHHIEIHNVDGEQIKVQKKYSSVLEVTPVGSTIVKYGRLPFQFPLNDSRIIAITSALETISQSSSPFLPSVHQLSSGSSVEAVVSFLIPMEVEDEEAGRAAKYDVLVVQGSNHKEAQVISVEKQKIVNQVTYSQAILNNGTLPDAIERLHKYLKTTDQML